MKRKIISTLFALVLVLSFSLVTAVPVAANPSSYSTDMGSLDWGVNLFDITDVAGLNWESLEVDVSYADGQATFVITPPVAFNPEAWPNDNFWLVFDTDNDGVEDFQVLYNTGVQEYPELYLYMPPDFHWATKTYNGGWSDYQPIPSDWDVSETNLEVFTATIPVSYLGGPGSDYGFQVGLVKHVHEDDWPAVFGTWPGDYQAGWSTQALIFVPLPSAGYELETVPQPAEVWVDDGYTDGGGNDGHIWGWDAFATIQASITGVAEAGTVNVLAGDYGEQVTINKGLTLLGANAGNPGTGTRGDESIIAGLLTGGGLVHITASDVTIDGFTIEATGRLSGVVGCVYITDGATGVTIENNIIVYTGAVRADSWEGIVNTGACEVSVKNNLVSNFRLGVYLNSGAAMVISNNTIEDSEHCGIGVDSDAGVTITNNTLDNNPIGIEVFKANVVANSNNITGSANFGVQSFGPQVDATLNWWGDVSGPEQATTNPDAIGDEVSVKVTYSPWLGATKGTSPMTFIVDDVGPEPVAGYIQTAINAANPGDTINVLAGTYEENITIPVEGLNLKSTTLHGANIKGPVTILADGVTLEGFDILGYVKVGGGSHGYGDVTVAYNKVTSSDSNGIVYGHGASTGGTVTHNVVSAPGKLGIYLDHDGGTFTVTHNTVEARKAIGFGSLSGGLIEYNTISSPSSDCDIEVFDASIATVNYNNLAGEVWNLDASNTLDATHNWWGDPNGPSAVSGDVDYSPWLPGEWELFYDSEGNLIDTDTDGFSDLEECWLGTDSDNATDYPGAHIDPGQVDTAYVEGSDPDEVTLRDSEEGTIAEVDISDAPSNVSGTITGARYTEDPGETSLVVGTGKTGVVFLDVRVTGYTSGMAHIIVPYSDADVVGVVEETLGLYYWDDDASMWRIAANSAVDTGNNIVSGDIPVSALTGTPIGMGAYPDDEATVAIGDISVGYSGNDVVELTITTNTAQLGAVTIDLTFDNTVVEVLGGENSEFDSLIVNPAFGTQTARFVANQLGASGVDATGMDGVVVAQVRLMAVGTTGSSSPLTLDVITLKDNDGISIPYVVSPPGTATIGGLGDANSDGAVDVYDCVHIARTVALISGYSVTLAVADVNGDGIVDVWDCTYLARHIAGIVGYEQLLGG